MEALSDQAERTARCCCGALSITVAGFPAINGVCHCDDCKRRTGSAFGWSAYFRDDQVIAATGAASEYVVPVEPPQRRCFCPTCGSTLSWQTGYFPGMTGVAGGAVVPPLPTPTASYRTGNACAWLELPADWTRHS